jgi:hypothetical protein
MESIWNALHKNPELACQIHVMLSTKSFEKQRAEGGPMAHQQQQDAPCSKGHL